MTRASDPILARGAAMSVVKVLRAAGFEAMFAGGCVRDELLGQHPTDYDVATSARPQQVAAAFARTQMVGEAFGVMLVPLEGAVIEVATFRSDGTYSDSRRPDAVTFTDARQDALRRDFTINAMFLDPMAPGSPDATSPLGGAVIDYVGGLADLRAGVVRAVGDPHQRLREDHLRALRAVRFASRLGFAVDPATRAAITQHAAELRGVSRERIGDELRRMLLHPSRAGAVALLTELGLDVPVLESVPTGRPAKPALLAGWSPPAGADELARLVGALACWVLDRAAPATEVEDKGVVSRWRRSLCLSNAESEGLRDVLAAHAELRRQWADESVAKQKRLAAKPWFGVAMTVLHAQELPLAEKVRARVGYLSGHGPGISPEALINGDDLVAAGFVPGPGFKRLLDHLYDEQLEGRLTNKPQAMELARRLGV